MIDVSKLVIPNTFKEENNKQGSDINEIKGKKDNKKPFDIKENFEESMVIKPPYIVINEKDIKNFSLKNLFELFQVESAEFQKNLTEYTDVFRPMQTKKSGGVELRNKYIVNTLRSSAKSLILQIGKKLISGDFNLTTISFPINVMIPLTILQSIARSMFQFPYYLNLAVNVSSIDKMKYVILGTLSAFNCSTFFLKPMNPILGETYEASWSDGSQIYLEQTSHHPPISHFQLYGYNKSYHLSGYSLFKSSSGLNTLYVSNIGKRSVAFKDGTKIDFNFIKVSL